MGRIQGLAETGLLTEDQLIKTGHGYVFSITIAWAGQTAGSLVYLRDGLDGTAPIEALFALPTASGTITKEWPQGKEFDTGIWYGEGGAEVFTEITYK